MKEEPLTIEEVQEIDYDLENNEHLKQIRHHLGDIAVTLIEIKDQQKELIASIKMIKGI